MQDPPLFGPGSERGRFLEEHHDEKARRCVRAAGGARMSSSPLVSYTALSPNCSARTGKIDRITIHHMAGVGTVESCGAVFASSSRGASANYGIGNDGRIGLYVPEEKRAWTSSNAANDNRAVTIEVSNSEAIYPWPVSAAAYRTLIELCADICRRNGIERLSYTGDTSGNLTRHNMFAATLCPGPYLQERFPAIAEEVNRRLDEKKEDENVKRYNTISEMPDWARETAAKLAAAGVLTGRDGSRDADGLPAALDLSEDMLRLLVILDRAGAYL